MAHLHGGVFVTPSLCINASKERKKYGEMGHLGKRK